MSTRPGQAQDRGKLNQGLNLGLHHEQVTTYTASKGFTEPFEALGFLFRGHEVVPQPSRVQRCRRKVIKATCNSEAGDIIDGFESYYRGPVPSAVLVPLVEELWRARRSINRARKAS